MKARISSDNGVHTGSLDYRSSVDRLTDDKVNSVVSLLKKNRSDNRET